MIVRADNRVVVMPNHQVWGGVVVNLTARATRRVDLVFSISYEDDINHAIHVLWAAVAEHLLTLDEPEPTIAVVTLGDHSVDILCAPWCQTQDYLAVQRGLTADLKQRFDAAGITMPYQQRDVHVHAAPGGDAQPGQLDTRRNVIWPGST
jgi:small conductance mechanosensitive channel